jgi:hypothetical protein
VGPTLDLSDSCSPQASSVLIQRAVGPMSFLDVERWPLRLSETISEEAEATGDGVCESLLQSDGDASEKVSDAVCVML